MTSRQTSVGTFWALASSSESASTSASPRYLKISPARCSPMATSRAAAFWMPFRLPAVTGASLTASSAAIGLVLRHPGLDLSGDALGLALHQLIELMHAGVRGARREHLGRGVGHEVGHRARLELRQRDRLVDRAQPRRRAEVLGLALLHPAGHEEEEQQGGEAQA